MLVSDKKHSIPIMFVHWATVLLIAIGVGTIFLADSFEESSVEGYLVDSHKTIGVVVLIFALVRIVLRFRYRKNYFYSDERRNNPVAQAVHSILYLVLLALPVLGILESIYAQENTGFIPSTAFLLLHASVLLSEVFHETHEMLASFLMVLLVGHVLMAFYHKRKHPDIFYAMVPFRKRG